MSNREMNEADLKIKSFMRDYFKSQLSRHFTFLCNWQLVKLSHHMTECSEMYAQAPINEGSPVIVFQRDVPIYTDDASELFICFLRMNKIDKSYHLALFAQYEQIMEDCILPTTQYITKLLGELDE